jgi:hypothetical protein
MEEEPTVSRRRYTSPDEDSARWDGFVFRDDAGVLQRHFPACKVHKLGAGCNVTLI